MGMGGQTAHGPGWTGRLGASLTAQPGPLLMSVPRTAGGNTGGCPFSRRVPGGQGCPRSWCPQDGPSVPLGVRLSAHFSCWQSLSHVHRGLVSGERSRGRRQVLLPSPGHTDLDGADCEDLAASGLGARRSESPPGPSNQPQGGQCLLRPLHLLPLPPIGPLGRTPPNPTALGTGLNPSTTRAGPCVSCSGGHGLPGRLPVVINKQIKSSLNPTL